MAVDQKLFPDSHIIFETQVVDFEHLWMIVLKIRTEQQREIGDKLLPIGLAKNGQF
jgi:hypothetical protein